MPAMLLAVASVGVSSCGDDNNDEPEAVNWSTSYEVKVELSDDVLKLTDVTAHIAYPDGTFRDQLVVEKNSSWTMTGDKVPDKAGVLLTFVPKHDIDVNQVYTISTNGSISATSYMNKGVIDTKSFSIEGEEMELDGDKVEEYFKGNGVGFAYGVNSHGKIVDVDLREFDFGLNGIWEWLAGVLVGGEDK